LVFRETNIETFGPHELFFTQERYEEFRRKEEEGGRYIGFTAEGPSAGVEELIAAGAFDTVQVRYNLTYQHVSDWHNNRRQCPAPPSSAKPKNGRGA